MPPTRFDHTVHTVPRPQLHSINLPLTLCATLLLCLWKLTTCRTYAHCSKQNGKRPAYPTLSRHTPPPDNYDDNEDVPPHFSPLPDVTEIPFGHRYNCCYAGSICDIFRERSRQWYGRYGLNRTNKRHGLYWMGNAEYNNRRDTVKTMVLVVELESTELAKWREIDPRARVMLDKQGLRDPHGVCVRYYEYRPTADVRGVPMEIGRAHV